MKAARLGRSTVDLELLAEGLLRRLSHSQSGPSRAHCEVVASGQHRVASLARLRRTRAFEVRQRLALCRHGPRSLSRKLAGSPSIDDVVFRQEPNALNEIQPVDLALFRSRLTLMLGRRSIRAKRARQHHAIPRCHPGRRSNHSGQSRQDSQPESIAGPKRARNSFWLALVVGNCAFLSPWN